MTTSGTSKRRRRRRPRPHVGAAVGFLATGSFYLLLIDTTSLPELYAGAGAALLATLAWESARRAGGTGIAPRGVWALRGLGALANVPGDVLRLSLAAVAQLLRPRARRGVLRAVPLSHAGRGSHEARRALAEALGSLAPNTIVIGVDRERELILAHQLSRHGGPHTLDVTAPRRRA